MMASERVQRRIDRLLDQAEEAMDRLDWGTVRECARVVLGLDPENSDALAFLTSEEQVLQNISRTQPEPSPRHLPPALSFAPVSLDQDEIGPRPTKCL